MQPSPENERGFKLHSEKKKVLEKRDCSHHQRMREDSKYIQRRKRMELQSEKNKEENYNQRRTENQNDIQKGGFKLKPDKKRR